MSLYTTTNSEDDAELDNADWTEEKGFYTEEKDKDKVRKSEKRNKRKSERKSKRKSERKTKQKSDSESDSKIKEISDTKSNEQLNQNNE